MRNEWTRPGMPGRWVVCALSVFGCIGVAGAQAQLKYEVLAGGWTGDGGQAKDASLHGVEDVVYDSAGNLYVSQVWANRMRKIAPNAKIIANAVQLRDIPKIYAAGADYVFSWRTETSLGVVPALCAALNGNIEGFIEARRNEFGDLLARKEVLD